MQHIKDERKRKRRLGCLSSDTVIGIKGEFGKTCSKSVYVVITFPNRCLYSSLLPTALGKKKNKKNESTKMTIRNNYRK